MPGVRPSRKDGMKVAQDGHKQKTSSPRREPGWIQPSLRGLCLFFATLPPHFVRGYFQPELSKLAGNRVVGGCSWVIPSRSDWPNEKQVVSVELLRYKLHREFFACALDAYFFWRALNVPDAAPESRRDGTVLPVRYPASLPMVLGECFGCCPN